MVIKKECVNNSINSIIFDKNISLGARGLLIFMLSCEEDYKFSIEGLCNDTNTKLSRLNTYIKELLSKRYLEKKVIRDASGKILEFKWIVVRQSDNYLNTETYTFNKNNNGYVYLLKMGEYYKIGITQYPKKRFRAITMSPYNIENIFMYYIENYHNAENYLHTHFSNKNIKGEWFKLSDKDIEFIRLYLEGIKLNKVDK